MIYGYSLDYKDQNEAETNPSEREDVADGLSDVKCSFGSSDRHI